MKRQVSPSCRPCRPASKGRIPGLFQPHHDHACLCACHRNNFHRLQSPRWKLCLLTVQGDAQWSRVTDGNNKLLFWSLHQQVRPRIWLSFPLQNVLANDPVYVGLNDSFSCIHDNTFYALSGTAPRFNHGISFMLMLQIRLTYQQTNKFRQKLS